MLHKGCCNGRSAVRFEGSNVGAVDATRIVHGILLDLQLTMGEITVMSRATSRRLLKRLEATQTRFISGKFV